MGWGWRKKKKKKKEKEKVLKEGLVSNEAARAASTYQFKSPERERRRKTRRKTEGRRKR